MMHNETDCYGECEWNFVVTKGSADVHVPTNGSLERRWQASDKSWIYGWLEDEIDPTEPIGGE